MTSPAGASSSTAQDMSPSKPLISLGLQRVNSLLHKLSSPHLSTPIVHIAGTNGKGSVSAYLTSILTAAQLRVGRFNSPHLVDEWDCLELEGQLVAEAEYHRIKRQVDDVNREHGIAATSFEVLTATAFTLFAQRTHPPLDLAVVEVGMGGLTDATNVVPAQQTLLSVLTPVELDHQAFLGDTIEQIARVKAGIIKDQVDVVLGQQSHPNVVEVVEDVVQEQRAQLWKAGRAHVVLDGQSPSAGTVPQLVEFPNRGPDHTRLHKGETGWQAGSSAPVRARLPLPGDYQLANSATAVLAAQILRQSPRALSILPALHQITDDAIVQGISNTRWPGRLDWLRLKHQQQQQQLQQFPSEPILVDGAHNPSSAETLATYLRSVDESTRPTTLIIGISAPRPPASLLTPLIGPHAGTGITKVVCVPFSLPSGMPWIRPTPTNELAQVAAAVAAVAATALEETESPREIRVLEADGVEQALLNCVERHERVVVAGSLYLAADVYRLARRLSKEGSDSDERS